MASFKELKAETDVKYTQRVETDELFDTLKGIVKPYSSASNLEIVTSSVFTTYSSYGNTITYVDITGSGKTYFATMRAESGSYEAGSGSVMNYRSLVSLCKNNYASRFSINDGAYSDFTDKIDVISISREYYKDGINPDYFAVLINTASSSPSSSVATFNIASGINALYPSATEQQSPIGQFRYLYLTSASFTDSFYNKTTDEFTVPASSHIITSGDKPYGEVYLNGGFVLLYTDKLKAKFANINTSSALHYVAGVVGKSEIQLNGSTFFCRMFNGEFNYSANPTFSENNDGQIIKSAFRINPVTFVTGVGLYNDDDELIAFGRPSTPLRKDFDTEYTFKLELNY